MNEPKRPIVMTTTNELFPHARIIYRVEDGPEHRVHSMRLREILAMAQYRSAEPIGPLEVLHRALGGSGAIPAPVPTDKDSSPMTPKPDLSASGAGIPASASMDNRGFSFLKQDRVLGREVFEAISRSGALGRYLIASGCCDNPAVDDRLRLSWDQPTDRGFQDSRDHESKRSRAGRYLPP